jgi:hypothetical protein
MTRLSRRALLASLGATTLTLAGCTSSDDDSPDKSDSEENGTEDGNGNPGGDETPDGADTSDEENSEQESTETDLDVPSSLEAGLGFVHLPESWDGTILRLSRPDRSQERSVTGSEGLFLTDDSTLEWVVTVGRPEAFVNGVVATGSVTVAESDQVSASGTQNGFDVYEAEDGFGSDSEMTHLATDGEFLVAGTQDWVETALSNHAEGVSPLASRDGVGAIVDALGVDNDFLTVAIGSSLVEEEVGGDDFSFSTVPAMFGVSNTRTEETVEHTVATWYTEPTGETERAEFTELVQSEFGLDDEPEQRHDGRLLRIQHSRPYVPPEERPEYPGHLVFTGYDSDADVLRFEFRDGDPVPVEDLEIEIADEPYDDWARGQEEVGEGSVVSIAADAVEPGDSLTVSYDSGEGYSGASTTSVLTHLPVQFSYDPGERRGTIEYIDGPPLPGDRLTLVLGENRTESPWDGQVTAGDSAVIEDVEIGTRATIEYERSDGEQVRVGYGGFRPPGRVEFDYDAPARELTIGYPDHEEEPEGPHRVDPIAREPLPADEYEIRIDGEPADTQLGEAGETFEPSEAITLTDVPIGVEVALLWVGEDGRTEQVAGTHTHPEVSFTFEHRDDGAVVVRHDGGMPVDAGKLAIETVGPNERTVQWDGTDTVTEGDQLAIEDVDEAALLLIRYDGQVLAQAHTAEIGDEESGSTNEGSDGMEDGSDSTESGSESTEGESGSMGRLFGPVTAR